MTVLKIGQKKLKITLTDGEVLSFFGAYERLNAATSETRLTVGLLLKESLSEYETEFAHIFIAGKPAAASSFT